MERRPADRRTGRNKFYEVGGHWITTNHTILPGIYLMSKVFWDKLPEDIRNAVKETAGGGRAIPQESVLGAGRERLGQGAGEGRHAP